jgi:hypothetical protein
MKTKVTATTSFMHGRVHAHAGDELEVTKGEAEDLVKAGLAADQGAVPQEAAPTPQADGDVDDLLGDAKMDGEVENKMDAAPSNKGSTKSTAKAK